MMIYIEDISHDASGKAPVGLCRTCYLALYDLSHGKALSVNSRSVTQFDFGLDINSLPKNPSGSVGSVSDSHSVGPWIEARLV